VLCLLGEVPNNTHLVYSEHSQKDDKMCLEMSNASYKSIPKVFDMLDRLFIQNFLYVLRNIILVVL